MPKIRHSRTKKPPEGFEDIEETLQEFARKMKDGNISLLLFCYIYSLSS